MGADQANGSEYGSSKLKRYQEAAQKTQAALNARIAEEAGVAEASREKLQAPITDQGFRDTAAMAANLRSIDYEKTYVKPGTEQQAVDVSGLVRDVTAQFEASYQEALNKNQGREDIKKLLGELRVKFDQVVTQVLDELESSDRREYNPTQLASDAVDRPDEYKKKVELMILLAKVALKATWGSAISGLTDPGKVAMADQVINDFLNSFQLRKLS